MTNPHGMRSRHFSLHSGDKIHVYADDNDIVLQLRRTVPTECDVTAPSFKVATNITKAEALAIAGELLSIASRQMENEPGHAHVEWESGMPCGDPEAVGNQHRTG